MYVMYVVLLNRLSRTGQGPDMLSYIHRLNRTVGYVFRPNVADLLS